MDEELTSLLSIDEAMDRIGYGHFQRRMLIAAGLCSASDAMEILVLRFLSAAVQQEWSLTTTQSSNLMSSVFVGAFCGTLFLGRLGDLYGRRCIFVVTAAIVAIFGLLSAACSSYWTLLLTRAMVGVGIGGVTVPFDTYAECLPKECRGKGLVAPSYFWTMGTVLVVVGAKITGDNWKLLCVVCAVPCMVAAVVGYLVVPESPHWLIAQSQKIEQGHSLQQEQALAILRRAAELNGKDPDQILPLGTRLVSNGVDAVTVTDDKLETSVCDLLAPQRIRSSLSILAIWFGYALLYYGTILLTTQIFTKNAVEETGVRFDYSAILFVSLAEVAATTFLAVTIDKWGRCILHALSFGIGGVLVLALCWMPSISRSWLVSMAFTTRFWIFSGSAVTWIWTAEVLETKHRTTGHSVANAGGRIGGFLAPYLISPTTMRSMGVILGLTSWLLVAIAWAFLPETLGKPLGGLRAGRGQLLELGPPQGRTKIQYRPLTSSSELMLKEENGNDEMD